MPESPNGRLVSWKEIAAYLGCDVRTCLRWEKERGLPIHRPGGQPGPRVMAWKHELDQWLAGKPNPEAVTGPEGGVIASPVKRGSISRTWAFFSALIIVAGGLAYLGIRYLTRDREPADFRIEGSRLIIQSKAKQDLWPFETGMEDLWPESEYRKYFQIRQWNKEESFNYSPSLVIRDLDGDGRKEVLFVPHHDSSKALNSNRLICFDHRGRIRWTFDGGREIVFGSRSFSLDFSTSFETHDIDGDGRREIIVLSESLIDYPTQLVILSSEGKPRGEYWQAGRITDLILKDLNGDGRIELLLGGVDEERMKAFFAVFDPAILAGASPNSESYRSPSLPAGTMTAYIVLPLADIEPGNDRHGVLCTLKTWADGRIEAMTSVSRILYYFDPTTLACLDIGLSNSFQVIRRNRLAEGKVRGSLEDPAAEAAYKAGLKNNILYWTGREFISTPTWVKQRP